MIAIASPLLPDRFWQKVEVQSSGCWFWTGAKKQGARPYGFFYFGGKLRTAHRVAYEALVEPVAPGMVLDHTCHQANCVNPSHLQAVSQKQNLENRQGPDRDSSSGLRGVYWYPSKKRWAAQVVHFGRKYHGGYFFTKEEAYIAVTGLRNQLFTNNLVDRMAPDG